MLAGRVDLQLLEHRVTEWALGQHAFDRNLERAGGESRLHFRKRGRVYAAGIGAVTVVDLAFRLVARDAKLSDIDHHDIVAGVHVRGKLRLVLASQPARDFGGEPAEHFAARVDNIPVTLNVVGFGGECSHR